MYRKKNNLIQTELNVNNKIRVMKINAVDYSELWKQLIIRILNFTEFGEIKDKENTNRGIKK